MLAYSREDQAVHAGVCENNALQIFLHNACAGWKSRVVHRTGAFLSYACPLSQLLTHAPHVTQLRWTCPLSQLLYTCPQCYSAELCLSIVPVALHMPPM
jgi:hypothetical protein